MTEFGAIELADVTALADHVQATEQQRLAEDVEDQLARRPRFEDKLARAIDRISRGTYSPQGMYAQGRDPAGQFAPNGCGLLDDFGRCSSRYHSGECFETVRSSAATGNAEAAEAWNRTLRRGTPAAAAALVLSNTPEPEPGPADQPTYRAMRQLLGLGQAG
jgi:hypothetical protein